ncbi:hypothetical protein G7Y89_g7625 [Cudoniella acicularis]|uniref:tRNA-splicing endonuclease subunit Sen54 N-terminal domain-containing protein n=1 Tax=Cudoniella acicularis TaxID=354080 RepID=A0A8H4RI62_9HELO|nr:hypothetical protein G7Y89_g7625 [Cudoniella acicularis]
MAEIDEDTPITSLHTQSLEDNDPSDETQDFRLLAALTLKSGQLPKRGEKDFEPHGTKHQDGVLEASRQAMHDALAYTRAHIPKNHIRGLYYGDASLKRDEVVLEDWRKGLDEDHVVLVESVKGPHFKTMGKATLGKKHPSLWLLPEEALYLVERGNLDLWWPTRSSFTGVVHDEDDDQQDNGGKEVKAEALEGIDEGAPMSLQAAYAMLIGNNGERGKVSLDRYTVYANLKRNGYAVFRAPEWDPTKPGESHSFQVVNSLKESPSIFDWLFGLFGEVESQHPPFGPLVKPGMYRSYNAIYRQIAIVPRHKPSPVPENSSPPAEDPYRVVFHLWKPTNILSFAKTNPGSPDFRVAITDARSTFIPSLTQITSLLESTPWDPPSAELSGPAKVYQRLRHGWRNVVLAVVDQGIISYLRLGETGFGEERLCDRFDEGSIRGGGSSTPATLRCTLCNRNRTCCRPCKSRAFVHLITLSLLPIAPNLLYLVWSTVNAQPKVRGEWEALGPICMPDNSMELDGFEGNTPAEPRSPIPGSTRNTPIREDAEKGIIVDAPSMELAETSAILLNNHEEEEDEDVVTPYYKRKRTSVNYNLDDLSFDKLRGTPHEEPVIKRSRTQPKVRGVIIGVWRDSSEVDDADKHVIYGFIDIHDRLRTRIYGMNRRGEELVGNIPMGAGGCWVTFPRIIFDPHLKTLTSAEIKEYVKLRSEATPETTPEERAEADSQAVLKAKQIVAEETASPGNKPIVHRPSLGRQSSHRQSLPRQTIHKTPSFQAVNAATPTGQKLHPSVTSDAKPHGVILGYWADSDEPRLEDKHAVFGVLSGTDCFRVKVQRVTRDGRFVDGNFPTGAGALWLHYEKVVFEPHLAGLTRPEVKEYCRIRQQEMLQRETSDERRNNELKAVKTAKAIVASEGLNNGIDHTPRATIPPLEMETRHSSRSEHKTHARQQAESEAASERARKEKSEAIERQHEKTRKEVAQAEAQIQEAAQIELKNNLKKLNKVWVAQQNAAAFPKAGSSNGASASEEVKYHNGIKYERKQGGPFQGKLVSAAQILSIDGEDYVEYRILTKPSF